MITLSATAQRLIAFTWLADTYSLTTNPKHPCMHADPIFHDLGPGESATIVGKYFSLKEAWTILTGHCKTVYWIRTKYESCLKVALGERGSSISTNP